MDLAAYTAILEACFPDLRVAQIRYLGGGTCRVFEVDEDAWRFSPELVHGDVDSSNVLWDEARGGLVGVLDFEETRLGDPAWDLCVWLAGFGHAFLDRMLAVYQEQHDGKLLARIVEAQA